MEESDGVAYQILDAADPDREAILELLQDAIVVFAVVKVDIGREKSSSGATVLGHRSSARSALAVTPLDILQADTASKLLTVTLEGASHRAREPHILCVGSLSQRDLAMLRSWDTALCCDITAPRVAGYALIGGRVSAPSCSGFVGCQHGARVNGQVLYVARMRQRGAQACLRRFVGLRHGALSSKWVL